MYIVVDDGRSLGAVICKIRFLQTGRGKCKSDTAAELVGSSGNIPVYSRNEWRHDLHGDQAGLSGSHTWPRKSGHYRVVINI